MSYKPEPDIVRGHLETYPLPLRKAIEQCHANPNCNAPVAYEVVEDTLSDYMDDEYGVVAECMTLREANEYAVHHVMDEWWDAGIIMEPPVVEVVNGMFSCVVQTDGSRGGSTAIFVRPLTTLKERKGMRWCW